MERLTIKDIAKMAGVSHTTVSRALNGAQNIRTETYAKIMELCGRPATRLMRRLGSSNAAIRGPSGLSCRISLTPFSANSPAIWNG